MTGPARCIPGEGARSSCSPARRRSSVEVVNTGDRPIQVGSHYHFAEANPALSFDRAAARGFRLAIPAGTSVRFEPGIEQTVALVALGGAPHRRRASAARSPGRSTTGASMELDRSRYAALYGPTTGDRIRLADTDLLIEVERGPLRSAAATRRCSAAARSSASRWASATATRAEGTPDLVITGARDPRPLGHRQGRHRRARRPHRRHRQGRQPRHHGRRPPGARDRPVHRDPGRQRQDPHRRRRRQPRAPHLPAAPRRGARLGHHHHHRRRHRPGRGHQGHHGHARRRGTLRVMLQALDGWPSTWRCSGKGNTVSDEATARAAASAGASGFKLHEDWGTTPAAIDACLRVCDE